MNELLLETIVRRQEKTTDKITKCEVRLILNINILTVNYIEVDNQKIMNLSELYMIGESKSEYEH